MSHIPAPMASDSVKEERKRKRAKDGEDGRRKSKKVKSKGQENGLPVSNGLVDEDASILPSHTSAETMGTEASNPKSKSSRKAQSATREVEENPPVLQDNEDKPRKRRNSDERKQHKLIEKFRMIEDQPAEIRGEELRSLLKKSEKVIKKKNLGQDDELVKLRNLHENARRDLWSLSKSTGGRYLDHDLVFSEDEKYILLASINSVHVYEAETSLRIRTMYIQDITCYGLSATNPHHLYVGNLHGEINLFDWTTGKKQRTIDVGKDIKIQTLLAVRFGNSDEDTILTIESPPKFENIEPSDSEPQVEDKQMNGKKEAKYVLMVRRAPWSPSEVASQVLHQGSDLRYLRVLDEGRAIIVAGRKQVFVGILAGNIDPPKASLISLRSKYRWRHLHASHAITCLDAQAKLETSEDKGGRKKEVMSYSIAVGNVKGEILIFDDIVAKIDKLEDGGSNQPPRARNLRWHREALSAVKWSKDGMYLISGGKETVLCIWQLETGRRQDLPHLTASIQRLTVSPSGTSYGIRLADNSIIVLSTAELQPKTHIAGLQSLCISTLNLNSQRSQSLAEKNLYTPIPLVNNPHNSKDILVVVPVDQEVTKATKFTPASPFLQTYNLRAGRHVSRQALTRNLVTEATIDPDWNKIEIPNVTLMQISHNGQWLATIEEWLPPARALQHLALAENKREVERRKRRETYLKIWRWDEESKMWALNTRVGQPHSDESNEEANRTFHLIAHPTKLSFATIGEDGCVRIWKPRDRGPESAWHAKLVINVERSAVMTDEATDFLLPTTPIIGRLAYSNDGSVLAVSQQDESGSIASVVHLLDAETGEVRSAETGLAAGYLVDMGFLDRYLILVSEELRIWDAVIGTVVYTKFLNGNSISLAQRLATTHLAISTSTKSFAVAGLNIDPNQPGSSVLVFMPTVAEPLFSTIPNTNPVFALAPLVDGTGFVVLNSQAELRTLTTHNVPILGSSPSKLRKAEKKKTQILKVQNEDIAKEGQESEISAEMEVRVLALQDDSQVLKSEQLAQVFARGSSGLGLPSVQEMFTSVAGLFAVKAR